MMNHVEFEYLIYRSLDDFYQRRANKLSELKLSDILGEKNGYLTGLVGTQKVSEVVGELLKIYLTSFDGGILGQTQWQELAVYPDFYQKLLSLMNKKPTQQHIEYENKLANALNRFEYEFLINFGNEDGSIDWEKLLRFNSGKEKIAWISSATRQRR